MDDRSKPPALDSARTRVRHWAATGAFWGGAWGLLGGPTLFYSATGTGLAADIRQAVASLVCGAAGVMLGAAFAGITAVLTRRHEHANAGRRFASNGLRIVDADEARAYGLYDDQRPSLTARDEPEQ